MEHRFITRDKFVCAIAICRQRVIDCSAEEVMMELLTASTPDCVQIDKLKPEMPREILLWVQSNEVSSANIRAETADIGLPPEPGPTIPRPL